MFKHRLMLLAAATAMLATPAYAACTPPATQPDTISTVGTSPIDTCTDGNIVISSSGGVKLNSQSGTAKADVTLNNPDGTKNSINNTGTLTNTNTANAVGILIDASATGGTSSASPFVTNDGTIDLTGSGTGKVAIELSGANAWTGNISMVTGGSVIKMVGDHSTAIEIATGSTLIGDMALDGTISMAPTSGDNQTTPSGNTLVGLFGTVKGNVTINSTASFVATGNGARGIVVSGGIVAQGTDAGTLINDGTIALTRNVTASGVRAEGGSALVVTSGIAGGILNGGPSPSSSSSQATLVSSGSPTSGSGSTNPVAVIENLGVGDFTIGALPSATDPSTASFANRGSISASPNNSDVSTIALEVAGNSAGKAILANGLFSSGAIVAQGTTKTGQSASATAIFIGNYADLVNGITISGETTAGGATTTLGLVQASMTGTGGSAQAIVINTFGTVPTINVTQFGKVLAFASTLTPTKTTNVFASAITDFSGTLTKINNAGTISASGTTLTNTNPAVVSVFNAIDLSHSGANNIVINDAGTISGAVLVDGNGTGALVNVGTGAATGAASAQNTAATNAALVATGTGLSNSPGVKALINGDLTFGNASAGSPDTLYVNDFGTYQGQLTSSSGYLNVGVSQFGTLNLTNKTAFLELNNLDTVGGTLGAHSAIDLTTSEAFRLLNDPTVSAISSGEITLGSGTQIGVTLGSYVPQSTAPGCSTGCQYILMQAPAGKLSVNPADVASAQAAFFTRYPYFFDQSASSLSYVAGSGGFPDQLLLTLKPKTPAQLGLTGEALTMFGPASTALLIKDPANQNQSDDLLGQAVIQGSTSQSATEAIFSQFAPDVSGDVRAVAIALTDQATGPVAARQRQLRMYANQEGDFTLWGQEFAQFIHDKGKSSDGEIVNYKDHGFGFALGLDMGNPTDGWYGGAVTFYAGDATEQLPRDAKNQTEWGMITGYTDWRGRHLFLDSQITAGYGSFRTKRILSLTLTNGLQTGTVTRQANGKSAGLMAAGGVTTGAAFNWGSTVFMPQISVDGLILRQEGFTETGGGDGFNLKVEPYYASSLRTFLGADMRQDLDLGIFTLQPEARLGYRFDFLNDPIKIKGAFAVDPADTAFTLTGPDPTRGNVVAGATLGASTDTWSMGLNFDWVRGSNGSTTEVGTLSLLGRI